MSIDTRLYRIGQSVRVLPDLHLRNAATEVYTVVRCNEPDSDDPSYVIQSGADNRQRREPHSRLRPAAPESGTASTVFQGR